MRNLQQLRASVNTVLWEYEIKQRDANIKVTAKYRDELKNLYKSWLADFLNELEDIEDEGDKREYIAVALLLLGRRLKELQRIRLLEAFNLGLAGDPVSPEALAELSKHIASQEKYVDESLLPYLEGYFIEHLDEEDYKEGLLKRAARVGLYAGAFWAAISAAQYWISQDNRKVTWLTQRDQKVCPDCLELSKGDWTAATLPTTPAMGDTRCLSNCRCLLIWEGILEIWPYQGG